MDDSRSRTHRGRRSTDSPSSPSSNPFQFPSTHPRNSRTIDCKYWSKGSCNKGNACTFRHSSDAISSSGSMSASPAHWGRTQRQSGRQHTTTDSESPQRLCEYYAATGTCKFGDGCKFSHATPVTDNGGSVQEIRPQTTLFRLKGMIK